LLIFSFGILVGNQLFDHFAHREGWKGGSGKNAIVIFTDNQCFLSQNKSCSARLGIYAIFKPLLILNGLYNEI